MSFFKEVGYFGESDLGYDMIMDAMKLKKLLGIKLSVGLNKVYYVATNENFSDLSKGLKLEISFDVIVPFNQSDRCIYVKDSYNIEGRGSKTNGSYITRDFFEWLIEEKCIFDYHNEEVPQFNENLAPVIQLIDVFRSGAFKAKYITVEHLKFPETPTEVDFSELKESTQEEMYIYTHNDDERYPKKYIVYENFLYELSTRTYCTSYKNYYTYFNDYNGEDLHVMVTNVGVWVKVKELEQIEPAEIMLGLTGKEKWSDEEISALLFQNEILFEVQNNFKISKGNKVWYFLLSENETLKLYRHNDDIEIKVKSIEGEIVFETDIEPGNDDKSDYETGHLSDGKYIKADIKIDNELKKMILAPVNIYSLKETSGYKHREKILYLYDNNLYGIVGEYEKVGIQVDSSSFGNVSLYISDIPNNEYRTFIYSQKELEATLARWNENKMPYRKSFNAFDERFKNYILDLYVNDTVLVTQEPNSESEIKGLKGVVEEISHNKQFVTVKFFNYFSTKLSINHIEKI